MVTTDSNFYKYEEMVVGEIIVRGCTWGAPQSAETFFFLPKERITNESVRFSTV